jgi:hypothetical protein
MYNVEHYHDSTAEQALKNISEERLKQTIKAVKKVIAMNDFELINRIELRDKRTGKIYK